MALRRKLKGVVGLLEGLVRGSAVHYSEYQHIYDPTIIGASTAVAAETVVQDFTGLPVLHNTGIMGASIVTGEALRILNAYLEEKTVHPALRATIMAGAAAVENYITTHVVTGQVTAADYAEMGFLQLATYGLFSAGAPALTALSEKVRSAGTGVKRTVAAATLGAVVLAGGAAANRFDSFNFAQYESITPFVKEGMADVDEKKLGLEIKRDWRGRYAVLSLQKGQALYSDVVLRYTDFLDYTQVMDAADRIAKRSSIDDPTKIPIGKEIRIPVELLADRYMRGFAPPSLLQPSQVTESTPGNAPPVVDTPAQAQPPVEIAPPAATSGTLKGKYFILDAGHGGKDPGSGANGLVENEVAYDVMVRLSRELQSRGGTVHPIVIDRTTEYKPQKKLVDNRDEDVLVTPPYRSEHGVVAANLRAYEVQDIRTMLRNRGIAEEDIVTLSIHSDALHSSAQGLMAYYPAAKNRKGIKKNKAPYTQFEEVRRHERVLFDGNKVLTESLSYTLGQQIMAAAAGNKVQVHENQPVRGEIYRRRGRGWTPAILQGAGVGLLVEVGNCNNKHDAYRMKLPEYRQRLAETITDGITTFYRGDT
jgi:N-acetylmuramoyl-L-alanine amidase